MSKFHPQLIVALDVDTLKEAKAMVDTLSQVVDIFKVGSQLFTAEGPKAVEFVLKKNKKVFLDLKYHDIPNTVFNAVNAAWDLGIFMLTVHVQGGKSMLEAAVKAAQEKSRKIGVQKPLIVGITALTSQDNEDNIAKIVLDRARLARESGLDGVVASSHEALLIRRELGEKFIIVTPGIRPSGSAKGDQKRISTPQEAVLNGSNYLVVGRPIIEADHSLVVAKKILKEIEEAQIL